MSQLPQQVNVVVEQAELEGLTDFEADFTEAVSQKTVSGEAFVERVKKMVISTMLKLLAWIWAAVTIDRQEHAALVRRVETLESTTGGQRGPGKRISRASDLKAVSTLKVFNSERGEHKAWHAKLVSVIAQLSENARKVMEVVRATLDEDQKYDLVSVRQVQSLVTENQRSTWTWTR